MEIRFANARLQKLCSSEAKLRGKYGARMASVIQQRLLDLAAVENLSHMRRLPGRCHELRENLDGMLAIDLVHPDGLVFKPAHDPIPTREDGGLDWGAVTEIEIVAIGDYH
jgi:proteic killer suppression protein